MRFIRLVTLSALLPGAVFAAGPSLVRGQTSTNNDNTMRRRTRKFGGGGFLKMDYLKDWRDKGQQQPVSTRRPTTPPTLRPTPSPTFRPTSLPTQSLTESPTRSGSSSECEALLDYFDDAFLRQEMDEEEIDLVPDGYSPGDFFLFGDNDLFGPSGTFLGRSSGRCVALQTVFDENTYCTMEFTFLQGSSIVLQGVAFELNVVGGTGCFENLAGVFVREFDVYNFFPLEIYSDPDDCLNPAPSLASPWIESAGDLEWDYVDWDENGLSPGDIYIFDSRDYITALAQAGVLEGECMILVDTETEKRFCTITFLTGDLSSLVMAQGLFDNMVITGGTGCFDGITGSIEGSSLPDGGFQYDLFLGEESSEGKSCTSDIFDETWIEEFGEAVVEYTDSFEFGAMFAFDNKTIRTQSKGDIGTLAGRCIFLNNSLSSYCNIVFDVENQGTIAVQGFAGEALVVVGGSGCFQGLKGSVTFLDTGNYFEYSWSIIP